MARASFEYYSASLKREISIRILFPNEEITARQSESPLYPVLYLLHGGANDVTTFERYTSIERYIAQAGMVAVLFSAENKYYRDVTATILEHPAGSIQLFEEYSNLIHRELPAFLTSHFHVSQRPEDTYIAGFSMGGYGAAYHALLFPDRFCAAGVFSGLVFQRKCCFLSTSERQHMSEEDKKNALLPELAELIRQNIQKGIPLPKFYLSNGTKDITEFLPLFERELAEAGADLTTDYSKPFAHEWGIWDLNVKDFINWLPRTDGHAALKRRNPYESMHL
ncbi:MAG: hypothetical protein HDR23_06705 [Lachnospiraceae bacterium]|nr:hypothetical protein [Lachnospiraceae bacterium]MBD5456148.1 hypothetical protein [Lachnospiraceae bacterium]